MVQRVGTTPIAAAFFAGRYAEVLAQTIDSARGGCDEEDTGFVVGALAFVGRTVEAELLLDGVRAGRSPGFARTLCAGAFFLSIAHCRAGKLGEGRRTLLRGVRETAGKRDSWGRSLLLQGVAGCHFFAAAYRRAGQAALRALASAQHAQFAYAQLLANDMRGHVLLRIGKFHEGLSVLERARSQAQHLSLTSNAHAIEISINLHRAALERFDLAIRRLTALLEREEAQDSYSRRSILLELATRAAWMGDGPRAATLLETAAPLCAGDDRAEAALLCGRAHLARVAEGWGAARTLAEKARAILPVGVDPSREVEILALLLGAAIRERDDTARAHAVERLRALADRSELYRASAWLWIWGQDSHPAFVPAEPDTATRIVGAIERGSLETALAHGLLGLVPDACARTPGSSFYLFDDALLVEDHGAVTRLPALPPRSRDVLRTLEKGAADREALLGAVWGIKTYRPERHDSVVKTTVSRLRAALGEHGDWLETDHAGYRLRAGVAVVVPDRQAPMRDQAEDGVDVETAFEGTSATARRRDRQRRALTVLSRLSEATVSELAEKLGTSLRTMSRDLSEMHESRRVVRAGSGPATRYRVASAEITGDVA